MARKHPISPNQTVIWAYQALAPEWGSPALRHPQNARKSPHPKPKKDSNTTSNVRPRKSANRSARKNRDVSTVSVLTARDGVCAEAKPSARRVRAGLVGRGPVRRRPGRDDLA